MNLMKSHSLKISVLTAAILATGFGVSSTKLSASKVDKHWVGASKNVGIATHRYIVTLSELPLAMYSGGDPRFAAIPRLSSGKFDLKSPEAVAYLAHLEQAQTGFLLKIRDLLGRDLNLPTRRFRMQHALNAMLLVLSREEAAMIEALPEVKAIEEEQMLHLDMDISPNFVGANAFWDGSALPRGWSGTYGDGQVVGILDTGINMASPSFSATSMNPDGTIFTATNPLGEGNYLGLCDPTNMEHDPARDICNSKLIGVWDYVDGTAGAMGYDGPGAEDENSHGTHTASTAAGNFRSGSLYGLSFNISGMAPHANVVAFDVCYTPTASTAGGCSSGASALAVDQAVMDGVVDVLNFSIGGGINPWTDGVSRAFLSAQNSGIFVAASAGNTRSAAPPAPGSTNHQEPWVTTVGAITHSRGNISLDFNVTGPDAVPSTLQHISFGIGTAGTDLTMNYASTTPLIISPGFAADASILGDGCSAYPASTFRRGGIGAIAVVRRGSPTGGPTCPFSTKATNAMNAGAVAVVIANNDAANPTQGISPSASGAPIAIPVLGVSKIKGDALRQYAVDAVGDMETAEIRFPGVISPANGMMMGDFSLLGPSSFALLKPDVVAPGVDILASVSRWVQSGMMGNVNPALNGKIGLMSGTSMSSPEVAGMAALVGAVYPILNPVEIKSILVTTAYSTPISTPNGSASADPFARGNGMVFLHSAGKAGLVLNETGENMDRANPAMGGNPGSLNLPSFQNLSCSGTCTFTRRVRSITNLTSWTATVEGLPAGAATVSPASFSLDFGDERVITLSINSSLISPSTAQFGEVVLTPAGSAELSQQRLPIAVRSLPAEIEVRNASGNLIASDNGISATLLTGQTSMQSITLSNTGVGALNWSLRTGSSNGPVLNQYHSSLSGGGGPASRRFPSLLAENQFAAEDFDVAGNATITNIFANGYLTPSNAVLLNSIAPRIYFSIYADQSGRPAGSPDGSGSEPLWSFSGMPTTFGLSLANNDISLNLVSAGIPLPTFGAGKYWLVVYPDVDPATSEWRWKSPNEAVPANASLPQYITAMAGASWNPIPDSFGGNYRGLSAMVGANVECGASWLSTGVSMGAITSGNSSTVAVTLNAASLAPGRHQTYLCISTNGTDVDEPMTLVPVTLTVTTPNMPPTATAQSVMTAEDTARAITLAGTDPDGNPLTYAIVTGPSNGVLSGTGAARTYTPNANFSGADSFTFTVNDGTATSAAATVSITVTAVNDAPVISAPSGITVTEDVASNVSGIGFSDVELGSSATPVTATFTVPTGTLSATSTATVTVGGTAGALTLTGGIAFLNTFIAANNLRYTTASNSTAGFNLRVSFSDGAAGASSDLPVTVTAVNDAPTVGAPATLSVLNPGTTRLTGVSVVDADAGGGVVTVTYAVTAGALSGVSGGGVTVGGSGTSTLTLTGTVASINAFLGGTGVSYVLATAGSGTPRLTVTINDGGNTGSGGALSATASTNLTLTTTADPIFMNSFE